MKKNKWVAVILVIVFAAVLFAGCSDAPQDVGEEAPADSAANGETSAQGSADEGGSDGAVNIAVVVKSTDSESWQYMLTGARNAAADSNGAISITEHGAESETDIEGQITVLESVISSEPDAIVITPSDSDALNASMEMAHEQGIKIIVVDTAVNTEAYDMFMANDNYAGGEQLAEIMVNELEEAGKPLEGTVGIVSAVPVQTVYDRDDGFIDKLAELAPNIKVISENYADNDMQKSMDMTMDYISAYPDLIGVYGDNNVTGSGIALAIAEAGMQDQLIGVAYDGNPEEIAGIRDGSLEAILVQSLYQWGYDGVMNAYKAVQGEELERYFDTGVTLVTLENIDDEDVQDVIDPSRLAR